HVRPGGAVAIAVADELELYETADGGPVPLPDMVELDGVVYASLPTAVRDDGDGFVLERRRDRISGDGSRSSENNRVRLDRLTAGELEQDGRDAGFAVGARAHVPATTDYVGSTVVILHV